MRGRLGARLLAASLAALLGFGMAARALASTGDAAAGKNGGASAGVAASEKPSGAAASEKPSSGGTSSEKSSSGKQSTAKQESKQLREAKEEKEALEQALEDAKGVISELKDSRGSVEARIGELNNELMDISSRIESLERRLAEKNGEIAEAKEDLAAAREDQKKQYEDMKVRIQFMYENGISTYIDALLSTRDIAGFLNAAEYISQIESYDRQKLAEYQETVREIREMKKQLKKEYEELEELKATVEGERESVSAAMRQKEEQLSEITEDIADAQSDAAYYEAEIQAQNEMIAAIQRAEAEKAAAGIRDSYGGGTFVWPCPASRRVTSDYGPRTAPMESASTNHQGIDIGAPEGSDICAAASGTVRAAAYSSAGGNYVMIDHGGGLYTVYMHASSLLVSSGQKVNAGDVIAKVGSTGISTGSHLHFGVSENGSYVSPWKYLGG